MERTVRNCRQVFAQPCFVEKALIGCSGAALLALVLYRGDLSKGVRLGLGLGAVSVLSGSFMRMFSFSLKDSLPEEAFQGRTGRNLQKALEEHGCEEAVKYLAAQPAYYGGCLSLGESRTKSDIGTRWSDEDAHLVISEEGVGDFWGVFDGHRGAGVSCYVRDHIVRVLKEALVMSPDCYVKAFEKAFETVHEEAIQQFQESGSTVCLCFRPEGTNKLYTATLADSEAFILRKGSSDEPCWIPLSCVRDWKSPKDVARAKEAGTHFSDSCPAEARRYAGLNVSRSIGDDTSDPRPSRGRVISVKPKVSLIDLQPGDRLIVVSDGVTDYPPHLDGVSREKCLETFVKARWQKGAGLVDSLIETCRERMRFNHGDNITVVYQEFKSAK